jgi:hypothetical protein
MELLFENEDTLLCLMKYIQNYYFNSRRTNNIAIRMFNPIKRNITSLPNLMLFTLCHTCKDFRKIILNKRYNFPKIDELMLIYRRAVILPRLENELKRINERKPILEDALRFLPIRFNILEHKTEDNIYINYIQKTIHQRQHYPTDGSNLEIMNRYFKEIEFENKDKITNFTSFEKIHKNNYIFMNFKICKNTNVCKCLQSEIQKCLKNKLF